MGSGEVGGLESPPPNPLSAHIVFIVINLAVPTPDFICKVRPRLFFVLNLTYLWQCLLGLTLCNFFCFCFFFTMFSCFMFV